MTTVIRNSQRWQTFRQKIILPKDVRSWAIANKNTFSCASSSDEDTLCLHLCRTYISPDKHPSGAVRKSYIFEKQQDGTLKIFTVGKIFAEGGLKQIALTEPLPSTQHKVAILVKQHMDIVKTQNMKQQQLKQSIPPEIAKFIADTPTPVQMISDHHEMLNAKPALSMKKYAGSFDQEEWMCENNTTRQQTLQDIPKVFFSMIQTLIAIRDQGLAHSDVKPANFLIDVDSDGNLLSFLHDFDGMLNFGKNRISGSHPYAEIGMIVNPFSDAYAIAISLACKVFGKKHEQALMTYLYDKDYTRFMQNAIVPKINDLIAASPLKDSIDLTSVDRNNYFTEIWQIITQLPPSLEKEALLHNLTLLERTLHILKRALDSNVIHARKLQSESFLKKLKNNPKDKSLQKFYSTKLLTLEEIIQILDPQPKIKKTGFFRRFFSFCNK